MAIKYKTNIQITSEAANKNEAIEIVDDYLSGNIMSGVQMKCITKPVRFYDTAAAKIIAITLLVTLGFLSGITTKPNYQSVAGTCQTAAIQPPLKTSAANTSDPFFKKEWEEKQTKEALNFIKR